MGCGGSKVGHDYSADIGPDGPTSAAPMTLLVLGHSGDTMYNGIYTRGQDFWNGKAMYRNGNGRFIYYYAARDGGTPGWSFDHRDQPDDQGRKDWYSGGFLDLENGPAYPPISSGMQLLPEDGGDEARVSILELDPSPPPAAVRIAEHPEEAANGVYTIAPDLWNGRPHYHSPAGWCFYYYAANNEGQPGWSLHPEAVPNGAEDLCEGGWVGPYVWSHPPLGEEVGFNDVGRCIVRVEPGSASEHTATAVHELLIAERHAQLQAHGGFAAQPMMVVTQAVAVAEPIVMAQPIAMAQPVAC